MFAFFSRFQGYDHIQGQVINSPLPSWPSWYPPEIGEPLVCPGGKGKQKKKLKYLASVEAISSTDVRAHP
jgi:hypothetical protein